MKTNQMIQTIQKGDGKHPMRKMRVCLMRGMTIWRCLWRRETNQTWNPKMDKKTSPWLAVRVVVAMEVVVAWVVAVVAVVTAHTAHSMPIG